MDLHDWLMFGVACGTLALGVFVVVIDHLPGKSSKNEEDAKAKNEEEEKS
jgi:hypothetical protein